MAIVGVQVGPPPSRILRPMLRAIRSGKANVTIETEIGLDGTTFYMRALWVKKYRAPKKRAKS